MPICKVSFVWPSPTSGTGPFTTGFHVDVPGGSSDQEDVVEALWSWWDTETVLKPYLSAQLGNGYIESIGEFGGSVVEYRSEFNLDAPTGVTAELAGVSARMIKVASRPAGGRRGSMFWPMIENSAHDEDGLLTGPAVTAFNTAGAAILAAVEGAVVGAVVVQVHNISGTESTTQVTSMAIEPSVSFLNRRYR